MRLISSHGLHTILDRWGRSAAQQTEAARRSTSSRQPAPRRRSAVDADDQQPWPTKREPWAASAIIALAGATLAIRPNLRLPICLLLIAVLLSPPGVASIVDVHANFMGATLEGHECTWRSATSCAAAWETPSPTKR